MSKFKPFSWCYNYYNRVEERNANGNLTVVGLCKFCNAGYKSDAKRMKKHLEVLLCHRKIFDKLKMDEKSVVYIKMNDARRTSDLATEVIRRWATAGHKFEGSKLGASAFKFAGRKKLPSVMNQFVIVGQPTVPDPLTRLQAYLSAGNCAALLFSWLNVRQNATILIGPAVLEFGNTYGHINLPTALRMNQSGLWNAADYGGAEVIFAVERVVHVPQYIAQLDEFVKNNSGFIL